MNKKTNRQKSDTDNSMALIREKGVGIGKGEGGQICGDRRRFGFGY